MKRILEGQRQLEEQFNQVSADMDNSGAGGVKQLREHAHSINATAQGISGDEKVWTKYNDICCFHCSCKKCPFCSRKYAEVAKRQGIPTESDT